jgi:hypothetical protein
MDYRGGSCRYPPQRERRKQAPYLPAARERSGKRRRFVYKGFSLHF